MRNSFENSTRNHDSDMGHDPERSYNDSDYSEAENLPKSFAEHMQDLNQLSDPLSTHPDPAEHLKSEQHQRELASAKQSVLDCFKSQRSERIADCKNRVFKTKFGFSYDDHPNVFRTREDSVYRITGMSQLVDIVNCGYIRPKEGKLSGGHENEVFWSQGGPKLNYIDERPILEVSNAAIQNGQIGALSLDDLAAVWVSDDKSPERSNKLDALKQIRNSLPEGETIDAKNLQERLHKNPKANRFGPAHNR